MEEEIDTRSGLMPSGGGRAVLWLSDNVPLFSGNSAAKAIL
jgi:hypothetical protein